MGSSCSIHEEKRNACRILKGKPEGKDIDIGWSIILKWILERLDGDVWTGLNWLRTGNSGFPL